MNVRDGRGRIVRGAIFHRIAQQAFFILLEFRIGMLKHGHPVNDAVQLHARGPNVRNPADSHERHESTVGSAREDRKSTRLNSSHSSNSYAVFCLKKKK